MSSVGHARKKGHRRFSVILIKWPFLKVSHFLYSPFIVRFLVATCEPQVSGHESHSAQVPSAQSFNLKGVVKYRFKCHQKLTCGINFQYGGLVLVLIISLASSVPWELRLRKNGRFGE